MKEELADVGGPDDQLVASEGEEVLKHSGLCSWVCDGKYYIVTEIRKLVTNKFDYKTKYLAPIGLYKISSPSAGWY